jgi:predicted metalloprotease
MADWGKLSARGNVEDRRGMAPLAIGGGSAGLLGIIVLLISMFTGGGGTEVDDLNAILNQLQQAQSAPLASGAPSQFEGADQYETFASTVLGSADEVWGGIFAQNRQTYIKPRLVLFRSGTQSGCGVASSEVGPHYCPADQSIYLDETFFDELQRRFKAKGGDVAEAYVIAHEVGHHVQNQLGVMDDVAQRRQAHPDESNKLSIELELQADCFAGVWAHAVSSQGVFEPGEINEAVDAAAAVGDDRFQKSVHGQINPETWTHGSSTQRTEWLNRGYSSGRPADCQTFK